MLKNLVARIIRHFGWDLRRLSPSGDLATQIVTVLNLARVNTVFDIGANTGQFAKEIREHGYTGKIVSFEPLTTARKKLSTLAAHDDLWILHDQCAIGERDGEIEINIAGNSVSSSVLPMLELHYFAAEGSTYIGSERVSIARLDTIANCYLESDSNLFIKIDTQGYERQVLDGSGETLKRAQAVLLELSLVPLYDGQTLWLEMIQRMADQGFTLWAIQKGFTDPRTGRSLQMDGIFLRQ